MKHFATFAGLAYNPKGAIPEGYVRDDSLSNRNRQVYVHHGTKEVVMAYRGTQPNIFQNASRAIADLTTDAVLAVGQESMTPRFKNALKYAKQTQAKYGGDYKYVATGHSLGSSQATYVANKLGIEAVGFSGHTPTNRIAAEFLANTLGSGRRRNVFNYTTAKDPVAIGTTIATGTTGKTWVVPQTQKDPHALANYLV